MDSDDKVFVKAFGSNTSSAISTPLENGYTKSNTNGQSMQDFLKSYPKKDMLRANLDKERKQASSSKSKISGELKKHSLNNSTSLSNQTSKKQPRKAENPVRLSSCDDDTNFSCPSTWVCKNVACKAVVSLDDTFCKRCSCCICHHYDDNKDPSYWFVCSSESGGGDWCGRSCHIECALQHKKAGVADCGQFMKLDGNYCCPSCGKVSGILGSWRKQLLLARDARRVDVLCHRIFLIYRLLEGTSRFKELHEIIADVKAKLEQEVCQLSSDITKLPRGIVSRLSIAGDVHRLCSLAIEKADECLKTKDSLPAACRFQFEEISSTSVVIVLKESQSSASDSIKGYKLWYYKSRDESCQEEPVTVSKSERRITISNLQPCTEYTFRIISFTEDGDLGHSESKCFTKSVEIISSGFQVRSLGKILNVAQSEDDEVEAVPGPANVARRLDLNVASVPDLNADLTPSAEDIGSGDNGSGEVPAVESRPDSLKRSATEDICDGDSTLVNSSPLRFSNGSGHLDDNYEYCVKVIRFLECSGHIEKDFRMKFLTWFSLRSSEQERRFVITFIRTLIEEPASLAGQLLDSFSEIVTSKRPRHGFCSKLWH